MSFKIGDMVICTKKDERGFGEHGKILEICDTGALVDFGMDIGGHSGNCQGTQNGCWWIAFDSLTLTFDSSDIKKVTKSEDAKTGDGKPDWTLLSYRALEEAVKVLEFGGKKYPRDSWKRKTGDYKRRYQAAAQRHLAEIIKGDAVDPESKLLHAAHLLCNAMFLTDFELDDSYRDNL